MCHFLIRTLNTFFTTRSQKILILPESYHEHLFSCFIPSVMTFKVTFFFQDDLWSRWHFHNCFFEYLSTHVQILYWKATLESCSSGQQVICLIIMISQVLFILLKWYQTMKLSMKFFVCLLHKGLFWSFKLRRNSKQFHPTSSNFKTVSQLSLFDFSVYKMQTRSS